MKEIEIIIKFEYTDKDVIIIPLYNFGIVNLERINEVLNLKLSVDEKTQFNEILQKLVNQKN